MIYPKDMKHLVNTVLNVFEHKLNGRGWNSPEARDLVLYTMMVESELSYLRQRLSGGRIGIARGIGQIEPATARSIINDFVEYRKKVVETIESVCGCNLAYMDDPDEEEYLSDQLMSNLMLNIAFVRIRYRWAKPAIPKRMDYESDDFYIAALGEYWVTYYNAGGKGTPEKFVASARKIREVL